MEDRRIRLAASAICVRASGEGPQVLVVERSSASRFLPGYIAFPGGAVEDADAGNAERWFRDPTESSRAAAVRELIEEVGLALTGHGLRTLDDPRDADPFGAVHAAPPSRDQLIEMAHWIAPPVVPVRFDARYFAVLADGAPEPTADGVEAAGAWWVTPPALYAEWERGERKLYWPTLATLRHLLGCETVDDILRVRFETREPTDDEIASLPRSVMEQD